MQHKVKNKNIKAVFMRKYFIPFSVFHNMFLLLYPQEALAASKEGDAIVVECSSACFAAISDIDRNIDSYKYGRNTAACGSDLE